ncbi:single-stranded DNA-binding protein [Brachybacterium sp. EF45031]|uniref:single-stranded DNA-binding protein n=1 Tax=Brachybacterium sillae TaxID=2810536 RepID=UPI00217D1FDE|nr:single-stranded DNA-binding protein [Brachybacterium sillae]MCS6710948.1 single-stranded DNA-binding protein [Brachybacterium sillae]
MREIRTTLIGNATRDPELREYSDGSHAVSVRLACTSSYYDRATGAFADRKTEYVTVYTRGALADNVRRSVRKGQPLIVTGRLGSAEWEREDGGSGHTLVLTAESLGHDLTYGATIFTKVTRRGEPAVDTETGEIVGSGSQQDPAGDEGSDPSAYEALGVDPRQDEALVSA